MAEKSPSLKQSKREAKLKNLIEKNKVVSLYFDSKEIGMFHKIVGETGLGEQTIANFIRRNGKKSILKERHLQIAKLLREQGYSFKKIAQILSDIEGFPIAENALLRVTEFNNPVMKFSNAVSISKENRTKTTKIRDDAIYLSKINNRGEIIEWGKIIINPLTPNEESIIPLVNKSVQTVSIEIKEKLIKNIYNAGIGPKKIAYILSQILDGNILENSIWICLQKLKNEKKITIQPVGFFNTATSKRKEVRI